MKLRKTVKADPARQAGRKGKKRRPPPPRGPVYEAWIVGHTVVQEQPLVVELIEAGGPASVGAAFAYLYRHFDFPIDPEGLGMETHGERTYRRWTLGGGFVLTAHEVVPQTEPEPPIDVPALVQEAYRIGDALAEVADRLNDTIRGIEDTWLEAWPAKIATVFIEEWEGYTQHLIWDKGLYVETSQPDKNPQRNLLTSVSRRLRFVAVDVFPALQYQLQENP